MSEQDPMKPLRDFVKHLQDVAAGRAVPVDGDLAEELERLRRLSGLDYTHLADEEPSE